MAKPYLHCHRRFKNGKNHCYWSIAEKVKTRRGWIQRHLLYLGEINDSQKASWTKATEVFDPVLRQTRELVHFPTTDGRELVFARYTQPEKDHKMLLSRLGWELPPQSPPRIT